MTLHLARPATVAKGHVDLARTTIIAMTAALRTNAGLDAETAWEVVSEGFVQAFAPVLAGYDGAGKVCDEFADVLMDRVIAAAAARAAHDSCGHYAHPLHCGCDNTPCDVAPVSSR